ncbi:alpha/beta hydrolase [Actinomadura macrotermitis]|uniref:Acetyl esterase n=1 Tax=Actinomadura macrotermitis TaxID=2585200 RepID=A0A7K0BM82_9ACTN|nr:alpha/beta hydrolase [Actinomadura macrotermitis]MQY02186.1 Acetyl esterase [Actinomadura macrotermitis]
MPQAQSSQAQPPQAQPPQAQPTPLVIDRRGTASLRSRAVAAGVRRILQPRLAKVAALPVDDRAFARAAALDRLAARARPPRGTHCRSVPFPGFGAEWVHGPGVGRSRERVILYLHGGGWVCCGLNTHRRMVAWFSAAAGVPALSVDYRMVPAVPFEKEVDDCVTAYRWLLEECGTPPENIVVMGDSAGGYLTFATALRAREEGLPQPAALAALSPMLDMDLTGKLAHANMELDPSAPGALLERLMEALVGHLDAADPKVSPVRADLTGLPPTLLTAGSTELLYCDSEEMARRLAAAGVPVTLQVWDRQVHVFQMFGTFLPESRRSIAELGRFVREAFTRADDDGAPPALGPDSAG